MFSLENSQYIEQCRELSLTAREGIALRVFESYCQKHHLYHRHVAEFLEFLWKWPLVGRVIEFEDWESEKTHLVNFGIGEELDEEVRQLLRSANESEFNFQELVHCTVSILWGSFWGACDNEGSISALQTVIERAEVDLPKLTPFKFSRFSDKGGWGAELSDEDITYWRSYADNA
ncbi:hypothetical protein M9194_11790 [Vibrio sp. S4M6]|uniref:hypothetical protein n=1 Tax=Vibrio sinus TaxID=2946865 RepID=UPI00202A0B61|nr:hypothetical protein [Vibrio sinus]MCL9782109.1 hypothetical protein [Vibrio sinus]